MILACHTLIYSDDADATRAFFRDVLGFPNVDAGTGDHNWLIFRTGPSELGVHPTGPSHDGATAPRHHAISFVVDDPAAAASQARPDQSCTVIERRGGRASEAPRRRAGEDASPGSSLFGCTWQRQDSLQSLPALSQIRSPPPELPQRAGETHGASGVLLIAKPIER